MRESDVQAWVNSIPDITSSEASQYVGVGSNNGGRLTNDFKEAIKGRLEIVYALGLAKKLKDQAPSPEDSHTHKTTMDASGSQHRKIGRTSKVNSGGSNMQGIKL